MMYVPNPAKNRAWIQKIISREYIIVIIQVSHILRKYQMIIILIKTKDLIRLKLYLSDLAY